MSTPDGVIYFDSRIDPTNFDKDAKSLQKKLGSVMKGIEKMSVGIENAAKATPAAITSARKKMIDLQYTIHETEKALEALGSKEIYSKDFLSLEKKESKFAMQLKELKGERKELEDFLMKNALSYESSLKKLVVDDMRAGKDTSWVFKQSAEWLKLDKKIQDTQNKIYGVREAMDKMLPENGFDTEAYRRLNAELEKAKEEYAVLNEQVEKFADNSDSAFDGITKSAAKFGKMFKLMIARAILREMINQIGEGFQNLAKYSSSFNKTMSNMKSSLSGFRNSLATAFAPIVEMAIPFLSRLVDWLTAAMNALAKFFSALSGKKTYTKATKAAESYAEAAVAAADAAERGARAFDEFNEIDSGKSAGGSAGGGVDVGEMFEEVEIESGFMLQLENIKRIITEIGMIALAWKLNDTFVGGLGKIALVGITIRETLEFVDGFMDAIENGASIGNLAQMVTSLAIAVTALHVVFGPTTAAIGLFIGSLGLLVVAIKESLENGLSPETVATFIAGWTAMFAGIFLLTGNFKILLKGLGAGLVIALIAGVIAKKDEIMSLWTSIFDNWSDAWEKFTNDGKWWEFGVAILEGLWNGLIGTGKLIFDWFINDFLNPLVENVKEFLGIHSPSTLFENIGINILLGLFNGLSSMTDGIFSVFTFIWEGIKDVFSPVTDWFEDKFTDAWTAVKNVFSDGGQIFEGIKEGISATFKKIVNNLISGINNVIAKPFNKINSMLSTIRNVEILGSKPFRGIGSVSVPQIPKLATGAVIPANREFLAVLGDQNKGTNIETPESLLRQIMREELGSEGNDDRPIYINVKFGNSTMKRILIGTLKDIRKTSGVEVSLG